VLPWAERIVLARFREALNCGQPRGFAPVTRLTINNLFFRPFLGESGRQRDASGAAGHVASQNSLLKPCPDWVGVRTSFGRDRVAQGTGQGPAQRWPARDAARPRMRRDGRPAAAYTWHVEAGCVLVVVDLHRDGWRSVTNDDAGVVADLAELQPDLLARVPLIPYQDSMGCWNALCVGPKGTVAGTVNLAADWLARWS